MKKLALIVCLMVSLSAVVGAAYSPTPWILAKDLPTGKTDLVTGVTGKNILLRCVLGTLTNACYMYFYSKTGTTYTQISGKWYFGANGGVDIHNKDLNVTCASGQTLGVWFSADPDSDLMILAEPVQY